MHDIDILDVLALHDFEHLFLAVAVVSPMTISERANRAFIAHCSHKKISPSAQVTRQVFLRVRNSGFHRAAQSDGIAPAAESARAGNSAVHANNSGTAIFAAIRASTFLVLNFQNICID